MKLQCVCGKVLNVPDSMAGERIRCKECGKVMTVRSSTDAEPKKASSSDNDPLGVKGHRRCGKCGRSWPVLDKICTACGVNMDTGATLYVSLDASGDSEAPSSSKRPGLMGRLLRFIGRKGH